MRALVIDDSVAMRMILSQMLSELGVDSVQASDGRAGLDLLIQGPLPDVVLVDWSMPVLDGYEFLLEVRKRREYGTLLIVMVTSETASSSVKKSLDAGADEYLMKPFTVENLKSKLELLGLSLKRPDPSPDGTP